MPQLGLGLGLHKNSLGLTPLQLLLKYTSAMWLPSKASGQPFPTLEPRTLPNGVSNVGWMQNVSVDVVLTSGMVSAVLNRTSYTQALIPFGNFTSAPISAIDAIQGAFNIPNWMEKNATSGGPYIPNVFSTDTAQRLLFDIPLGTTLEQARALLTGTVIRYQLATPIDTINSPFTNPLIDLKGNAPLTLQGFAGTTSSGYVGVLCPNGRTVPFLKFDGTNDYGIANHPSLDITGTGDFAIECVFKTDATVKDGIIVAKSDGTTGSDFQYMLLTTSSGGLTFWFNDNNAQVATGIVPNTIYKVIVYRYNGRLKCLILGGLSYNELNSFNILSKLHFRVGAYCFSTDGLSNGLFNNIALGHLAITNGQLTPFTEAELISKFDKFTMQTFGI